MELCLDNPREGFSDLFATHPSVSARVQALVKFGGGHDPGPIALPSPTETTDEQALPSDGERPAIPKGPWSDAADPAGASPDAPSGPWGNGAGPSTGPASGPLSGPWGRH